MVPPSRRHAASSGPPTASLPDGVTTDQPLAAHTTLGVGGAAAYFARPADAAALAAALAWAHAHALPVLMLGGGSNLVVADAGFAGLVCQVPAAASAAAVLAQAVAAAGGLPAPGQSLRLGLPAGVHWDALCQACVALELAGLECLVGIPGTLGAAPLQNVGAYGQELSDVLLAVEVLEVASGRRLQLAAAACGLGYRRSHFKGEWAGRYVVVGLQLQLTRSARTLRPPSYPGLQAALRAAGHAADGACPSLAAVAACVLALRREKSMVWDPSDANTRSAGSFFVNPVVDAATVRRLRQQAPDVPVFAAKVSGGADACTSVDTGGATDTRAPGATAEAATTVHKVPAAWLIERAGLRRGHRFAEAGGRVGLSPRHALALVNTGGATAADVVAAASAVVGRVEARFGLRLRAEPQFVGFAPAFLRKMGLAGAS